MSTQTEFDSIAHSTSRPKEHNLKWKTTTRPVGRQLLTDRSSGGGGGTLNTAIIVDDVDDERVKLDDHVDHTDDDETLAGDDTRSVDDLSSISSESSGDGGGVPTTATQAPGFGRSSLSTAALLDGLDAEAADWQANDECEQIVRELPDSTVVLEALTAGDFTRKWRKLSLPDTLLFIN